MKILAFSDSHMDTYEMRRVLEKTAGLVSAVIHAGDGWAGIHDLMLSYPNLPLYAVPGNCDSVNAESILVFSRAGKKFLITHGHRQHVKSDYKRISFLAEENEADVCLFGHTHNPAVFYTGKTLMVNPGSIGSPKGGLPCSYAVIDIADNGVVSARIAGRMANGVYRPMEAFR